MKQDERPFWLKLMVPFGIGAVLTVLYLVLCGFFRPEFEGTTEKAVSDALLLPGVLLTLIGVLSWVASKGFFDLPGFATYSLFGFFIPRFKNDENRSRDLYEYKKKKEEKGRYWLPQVLIPGLVFLAASVLTAVIL